MALAFHVASYGLQKGAQVHLKEGPGTEAERVSPEGTRTLNHRFSKAIMRIVRPYLLLNPMYNYYQAGKTSDLLESSYGPFFTAVGLAPQYLLMRAELGLGPKAAAAAAPGQTQAPARSDILFQLQHMGGYMDREVDSQADHR